MGGKRHPVGRRNVRRDPSRHREGEGAARSARKKTEDVKRHAEHDLNPHEGEETFIGGDPDPDEDDTVAPG